MGVLSVSYSVHIKEDFKDFVQINEMQVEDKMTMMRWRSLSKVGCIKISHTHSLSNVTSKEKSNFACH
jgi:hypothetical protein